MKFIDAARTCHVRSAIYRTGDPTKIYTEEDIQKLPTNMQDLARHRVGTKIKKLYWRNHGISLSERVPDEDQAHNDWAEYDPREQEECSAFNEMPA